MTKTITVSQELEDLYQTICERLFEEHEEGLFFDTIALCLSDGGDEIAPPYILIADHGMDRPQYIQTKQEWEAFKEAWL